MSCPAYRQTSWLKDFLVVWICRDPKLPSLQKWIYCSWRIGEAQKDVCLFTRWCFGCMPGFSPPFQDKLARHWAHWPDITSEILCQIAFSVQYSVEVKQGNWNRYQNFITLNLISGLDIVKGIFFVVSGCAWWKILLGIASGQSKQ